MSDQIIEDNKKLEIEDDFDHEDMINKLEEIAGIFGFESFKDQDYTHVAKGSIVDLVWETKIANIGQIRYVFEVQSKGNIKSLIDNLINSINNPNVKKVIVVSDQSQLNEVKNRVISMRILNDYIRNMFVYLDVEKVNEINEILPKLNDFRNNFRD